MIKSKNMNKLILIGTTLGNIEDISLRAMRAAFETPVILAEDTRVFYKLKHILKERYSDILSNLGINTEQYQTVISYREQNHSKVMPRVLEFLETSDVGLCSDAGMPAISDPGYQIVRDLISENIEIDCIPSPTAVTTALVLSGLPTDRFSFIGFLPRKRKKLLDLIFSTSDLNQTIIFYESPYRIIKVLSLIQEFSVANNLEIDIAACSELTKKFQKVIRGNPNEVVKILEKSAVKGEWTVCLRANLNPVA